jgi:hypothetical protein
MAPTIDYLNNLALNIAQDRIQIKNNNNGYAYMSCVILDKKKSYYVLFYWN